MNPTRAVAGVRLAFAVLLVAAPKTVLAAALAPEERGSKLARGVVAVLGLRNLAHAAVELADPTRGVLIGGAAVDALHALSFVPLASRYADRRWRKAALLNVATATAFCVATTTTVLATGQQTA